MSSSRHPAGVAPLRATTAADRVFGRAGGHNRAALTLATIRSLPAVILGLVLSLGFALRLFASFRLTPHVDEASSILAAHATALHGWPILPSGTVYFQGFTLSALLAPLVWLGVGELPDLTLMRLAPVLAGTATIYLCWRLAVAVTGDARVGLMVATLVALDPVSVQWSGHVRMYGLLQAIVAGLAWAFILLLERGPSWSRVALVTGLAWAAVFTHIGASLVLIAMAVAALLLQGRRLRQRPDLIVALAMSGLAPVTLLVLNALLGAASVGAGQGSSPPVLTFVGDNLLQPLSRLGDRLTLDLWEPMTRSTTLTWLVPGLIVAGAAIVAVAGVLAGKRGSCVFRGQVGVIALLVLYWLPVIVVGVFAVSPKERYLLHVHLLGYIFVAMVIVRGLDRAPTFDVDGVRRLAWPAVAMAAVLAVATLAIGATLLLRLQNPVVHPDYHQAMSWVAERHQPGAPIIVALPAVAHLALDDAARQDVRYLAGTEDQPRAQRYTRTAADGRLVDYWIGVEAVVTTEQLRALLVEHPDAWIVVDEERLTAEWAYAGGIGRLLAEMTIVEHRTSGGGLVLRVAPAADAHS